MLPIYVCYDSGLDDFEIRAIDRALIEIAKLLPGRQIVKYGNATWSKGDYSSADWYVRKARLVLHHRSPVQIDASSLLRLLQSEPWQQSNPHIDLLFTSRDLTATGLNFCFGMASGRASVQSVARYRCLPPRKRELAIKAVIHHELGHILGCANITRSNTEMNLGPHCTNHGCIMRQGLNLETWVRHAEEAKAMGRIYCPQCLAEATASSI